MKYANLGVIVLGAALAYLPRAEAAEMADIYMMQSEQTGLVYSAVSQYVTEETDLEGVIAKPNKYGRAKKWVKKKGRALCREEPELCRDAKNAYNNHKKKKKKTDD